MSVFADRDEIMKAMAQGRGVFMPMQHATSPTTTAAAAASGGFSVQLLLSHLSTIPGTLVGYPFPAITADIAAMLLQHSSANTQPMWLGRIYKLGTVNLAATGDQFTHDAATFPATRRVLGVDNTPISLIPLIRLTTALTTTAAVIRMRTAAGGTGYVDPEGNNVVGARSLTYPSATAVTHSTYILPTEEGDAGVWDIVAIEVTTAAAVGAADVWGFEPMIPMHVIAAWGVQSDLLFGGLQIPNLAPALPSGGTFTQHLCMAVLGSTNGGVSGRSTLLIGAANS